MGNIRVTVGTAKLYSNDMANKVQALPFFITETSYIVEILLIAVANKC